MFLPFLGRWCPVAGGLPALATLRASQPSPGGIATPKIALLSEGEARRLRLGRAALVLLGVFGVGFENSHGVHALYEHWWCVTPLVVIALGVTSVATARQLERHGTA